ncbi:hypothetical protein E2C01_032200 [Portunus trituberculatus]|uniref:Uncharacterized protein n=1 Tax=Portunus trituberculatus TaxID=210409 RepID=A0A5B7F099_PORTR|nr:hypothetical protein [Portunus trituberculatus]
MQENVILMTGSTRHNWLTEEREMPGSLCLQPLLLHKTRLCLLGVLLGLCMLCVTASSAPKVQYAVVMFLG